jgi:hypothetical protein
MDIRQLLHDLLHFPKNVVGGSDQDLPGLGQRNATAVPVEERTSELLFEQADLPADRGLRNVKTLPGPGEAVFLGHGEEHLELTDIHVEIRWR